MSIGTADEETRLRAHYPQIISIKRINFDMDDHNDNLNTQ